MRGFQRCVLFDWRSGCYAAVSCVLGFGVDGVAAERRSWESRGLGSMLFRHPPLTFSPVLCSQIELPNWADVVKTGVYKELAPYDPDWYFVRCASVARKLYLKGGIGVGKFKKIYGTTAASYARMSGAIFGRHRNCIFGRRLNATFSCFTQVAASAAGLPRATSARPAAPLPAGEPSRNSKIDAANPADCHVPLRNSSELSKLL